jgi:hypothetical protein
MDIFLYFSLRSDRLVAWFRDMFGRRVTEKSSPFDRAWATSRFIFSYSYYTCTISSLHLLASQSARYRAILPRVEHQ